MLDRNLMSAASQRFRLLFMRTMQSQPSPEAVALGKMIAMQIPTTDWTNLYRWFEGVPVMRHWIGDRKYHQLKAQGFQVIQKYWESSINVLREDIEFDNLGGYEPAIMKMANEILLLPWREAIRVLRDGRAGTLYGNCFDGQPLISASHTTGTNLGTAAFTAAALADAVKAMRGQTDPTVGDDLLIEPTHIWYHPDLEVTVSEVINKERVIDSGSKGAAESNIWYKALKKLPMRGLTSTEAAWWGLLSMSESEPLKPILWQFKPGAGKLVALDKDTDIANFERRELKFGTEEIGAAAPGFPQYIWASDGTT